MRWMHACSVCLLQLISGATHRTICSQAWRGVEPTPIQCPTCAVAAAGVIAAKRAYLYATLCRARARRPAGIEPPADGTSRREWLSDVNASQQPNVIPGLDDSTVV